MAQTIKTPGPDHPISITPEGATVSVLFEGHLLGQSDDVLVLREADLAPVRYFPAGDIETVFLRQTDRRTYCAYKGEAIWFTIYRDAEVIDNAAWTYENPHPAVAQIAGRIAFLPEHVDFQITAREPGQRPGRAVVDEVIQHTDSGSGSSQQEPWGPTVTTPTAPSAPPYNGVGSI